MVQDRELVLPLVAVSVGSSNNNVNAEEKNSSSYQIGFHIKTIHHAWLDCQGL